jgi:hypothetical protein
MKPTFLVFATVLFATGCPNGNSPEGNRLPVQVEHQACTANSECVLVQLDCSDCDCGTPVNKKFQTRYLAEKENQCAAYRGPVCDLWCLSTASVCLNGKCIEQKAK